MATLQVIMQQPSEPPGMRSFAGSFLWEAAGLSSAWRRIAEGMTPADGLGLTTGTFAYAARWGWGRASCPTEIGQAGSISVLIFGSARWQPQFPHQSEMATRISRLMASGEPLDRVLDRLEGEFVLAAWDLQEATAYLAVDPVGRRELYYAAAPGGIAWSSHAQTVARLIGRWQLDPVALGLYLGLKGIPAPWSLVAGVRKLRPGWLLQVKRRDWQEREYWPLAARIDSTYEADFAHGQDEFRELLTSATRRCVADAGEPVGVSLSGGLDSTVITAIAHQEGIPLRAFSVGYAPPYRTDESRFATLAANEIGVPIQTCNLSATTAAEIVQTLVPGMPEPLADAAVVPTLYLASQASGGVQMMLDGTGAGMVAGGSNKYVVERLTQRYLRIPAFLRRAVIGPASRMLPASRRYRLTDTIRKGQMFIAGSELSDEERHLYWSRFLVPQEIARLVHPRWLEPGDPAGNCLQSYLRQVDQFRISATSYMTLKTSTPWVEMFKLSCVEQQTGISMRSPFLSPPLIEFGLRLPDSFKLSGSEGKVILRRLSKGLVPDVTLQRPKANFSPPVSDWLKGPVRDLFWDTLNQPEGAFDRRTVRRMVRENELGWRDWQSALWAIFVLQYWWLANS